MQKLRRLQFRFSISPERDIEIKRRRAGAGGWLWHVTNEASQRTRARKLAEGPARRNQDLNKSAAKVTDRLATGGICAQGFGSGCRW